MGPFAEKTSIILLKQPSKLLLLDTSTAYILTAYTRYGVSCKLIFAKNLVFSTCCDTFSFRITEKKIGALELRFTCCYSHCFGSNVDESQTK